jgi:large subunit ribosomal protein L30
MAKEKASNISKGMIKVTQKASPIGRHKNQRATLIGLGLNKINRSKTLQDTPSIRGMIETVHHLVEIQEIK